MSYRFSNTEKWADNWFSNLTQLEMLLFIYLCDNCNIAGFIEINYKRWANDLNSSQSTIKGAIKGLSRCFILSKDGEIIYLKNFLKHQKNLPLNPVKNPAHRGIVKIFNEFLLRFDYEDINKFIEGATEGLQSPTGNGIGNDKDKDNDKDIILWKTDFEIYKKECNEGYKKFFENEKLLKEQERLNPGINVRLSIEKGYKNFWIKEAGWKHKKASRIKTIDWESTIINSIGLNKVYYTKEELAKINQ